MFNVHYILFLFLSLILLRISKADICINKDACLCRLNDNEYIDISKISQELKKPYYLNSTINQITYTFVGCRDQNFQNVNGSLIITNGTKSYSIGNDSQIKFGKEDSDYSITYVVNDTYQPKIFLVCNHFKIPFLKFIYNNLTNPVLLLSSPTLCIQTEHHSISGGSTFLLVIFILASIYFIGGGLLLYFIRGARGAEIIPNIEFWRSLPGLVKDGLIFLLSGCRPNLVTTAETYDRI